MQKILLLGGSKQQISAIECARKKGYYTILCDYLEDNPGQRYADKFYCISTTNKEAVLKVAKDENIDGIVAYASDPAAPTAAYVAEKMGLPANPYDSVKVLSDKGKFRSFLSNNNFCTPKAKVYSTAEQAQKEIGLFKLPLITKPVDSSGSKGVSKLENIKDLKTKFQYALKFSRSKQVILEEFVEMNGYQVAGDGFSVDGKLKFRCFGNDHFNMNGINPFVPISASFPYNMPQRVHKKIHDEIQRLFDLLNIQTGSYNFDIRVDKDENVYLMEIGARNGGNYIPQVIHYATGIDLIDYTIRAAMGEDCSNINLVDSEGYWSYYAIHSTKSGILKKIILDENVRRHNIVESYMNYKPGDKVYSFTGANTCIGILIMKFESRVQMLDMMDHSENWINVIVE